MILWQISSIINFLDGWYTLFIVIYNVHQISGFYHAMRAKTSDFKSLFPVFVFRKTVLTDFRHSHGLEKDDKLSKISSWGTNHNLFYDDFCRHSILENMEPIVTSLNPCPSFPSVAKKRKLSSFQWLNIALLNKTGLLFLEFKWCEDMHVVLFQK